MASWHTDETNRLRRLAKLVATSASTSLSYQQQFAAILWAGAARLLTRDDKRGGVDDKRGGVDGRRNGVDGRRNGADQTRNGVDDTHSGTDDKRGGADDKRSGIDVRSSDADDTVAELTISTDQRAATFASVKQRIDTLARSLEVEVPTDHAVENTAQALYTQLLTEKQLFAHATDLGYAYQYLQQPSRKDAQLKIQTASKGLSREQVIAFTQLYTPTWIVDFLLQNTILPQLASERREGCSQHLFDKSESHALTTNVDGARVSTGDISLLDPCCGSGHFLIRAFELLYQLHIKSGAGKLAAADASLKQIHGADIDRNALFVSALSLTLTYFKRTERWPAPNLLNLEDISETLLGSLSRDIGGSKFLNKLYSVVVTNPPYIGRKLLSRELKAALKADYPGACHDLSSPFLLRAMELLNTNGRLGFITQASLLSLPSFAGLRQALLDNSELNLAVDLGSGAFPLQTGEKVNSLLLVATKADAIRDDAMRNNAIRADATKADAKQKTGKSRCKFIDLTRTERKNEELQTLLKKPQNAPNEKIFHCDVQSFRLVDGNAFLYNCPSSLLKLLATTGKLDAVADIRQGLATTDNKRFVKYWWEVEPESLGSSWVPYVKGMGTERWSSPSLHVINWGENGREIKEAVSAKYPYLNGKIAWVVKNEQYYFREGLCFSFVSTQDFTVRRLPSGCIFDVAASAIFAPGNQADFLLAYLNSGLIRAVSRTINPTINTQVGDVKNLPLFTFPSTVVAELGVLSQKCCRLKSILDSYLHPPFAAQGARSFAEVLSSASPDAVYTSILDSIKECSHDLTQIEKQIDELVFSDSLEIQELSQIDRDEIKQWIEGQNSARKEHGANKMVQPRVAAELALTEAVFRNYVSTNPTISSPAAAPAIVGTNRTVELELNDARADRRLVKVTMTDAAIEWLEQSLGCDLLHYLRTELNTIIKQGFKSRSPFVLNAAAYADAKDTFALTTN